MKIGEFGAEPVEAEELQYSIKEQEFYENSTELQEPRAEVAEPGKEYFDETVSHIDDSTDTKKKNQNIKKSKRIRKMGYAVAAAITVVTVYQAAGAGRTFSQSITKENKVVDSITGQGISATIEVNNCYGQLVTTETAGWDGTYDIDLVRNKYEITISADGYQTETFDVTQSSSGKLSEYFVLSPKLKEGEVRIVLQWGEIPADLDGHLSAQVGGITKRIFYANPNMYDEAHNVIASMDWDDRNSYGPETITIKNTNYEYTYAVNNYLREYPLKYSDAVVKVYRYGEDEPVVFNFPNKEGEYWEVFRIKNGELEKINKMREFIEK